MRGQLRAGNLHLNGTRRLIGSFSHGSMANALPHAIGAQAAQPGRQVIALSGEGSELLDVTKTNLRQLEIE